MIDQKDQTANKRSSERMRNIKDFSLLDAKGDIVNTKKYIPTSWYVLENHYAYTIKINYHATE